MSNRFEKYAQQGQQGTTFTVDPYAPNAERRAEEDQALERERLRIAQENAALAREKAERDAAADALKLKQDSEQAARLEAAQKSGMSDALYQIQNTLKAAKDAQRLARDGSGIGSYEGSDNFRDNSIYSLTGINQDSKDVQALLDTVGSNTAFDRLQKMREESPTGGALGAVSEIELRLLKSSIASLSQEQSDEQFERSLQRVIDAYTRVAAKLDSAERYVRENGSMEGYVPPSDEEIANFSFDAPAGGGGSIDMGGGNQPGAAGSGATETRIPVPDEMQAEYRAYINSNWGKLDAQDLSRFMTGLETKYNRPVEVPDYGAFVDRVNDAAAQGADPSVVGPIPETNRDLSQFEQIRNEVISNPFGTGATAAINSLTLGVPAALAGRERMQAAQDLNPGSAFVGDVIGGTAGTVLTGGALGLGARALGASGRTGTIMTNPLTADIAYGSTFGGLNGGSVEDALIGGTGALVGDQLGRMAGRGFARLRSPDDPLSQGQRVVLDNVGDVDEVSSALTRAESLGVPMTLADASPELQSLAGSSVRFSPTVAGQARDVMYRRNQGQLDRLAEAVERDLGPVSNIPQRSDDLLKKARAKAGPLYEKAYAAPGAEQVEIADLMQRPTFKAAMNEAYREAQDEGVDPRILGFVMDESGEVNIDPAMFGGRYSRATVNAESNILQPRTIRAYGGREVVKRGPLDLVGWVRTQGGLRDSGGELASMGLTNASRGRMGELVGRETEFGPLVNAEDGLDFDRAAEAAWEAGYFPELNERPDINTFLDALRDTADGVNQRFAVDDLAEVDAYRAATQANNEVRTANGLDGGLWDDASQAAGPRDFAPAEAYGDTQAVTGMSWQGLDYIKRGLDNVIERNTDKINGANPDARRALEMKNMLLKRMDDLNWSYADARAAYAGPMQERGFLQRGVDAYNTRPDELGVQLGKLTPEQQAQMRLGYQSEVMGRAGNLRNNSNPWAQLNTPNTEGRMGVLYEGAEDADIARLLDQRDLELQLAGSANRLIGNSATAEREVADAFFQQQPGMSGDLAAGIVETGALGGPWLTVGKRFTDKLFRDRAEAKALQANRDLADEIGPLLLGGGSPRQSADELFAMSADDEAYQAILADLLQSGEMWGRRIGTGVSAGAADYFAY